MTVPPPPATKAQLANLGYSRVMEGRKRMKQMWAAHRVSRSGYG